LATHLGAVVPPITHTQNPDRKQIVCIEWSAETRRSGQKDSKPPPSRQPVRSYRLYYEWIAAPYARHTRPQAPAVGAWTYAPYCVKMGRTRFDSG